MFIKISEALAASRARREDNEKGFTLIELLVVVLIIGILSAIAIPIFLNQQAAARDSAVQSDITNLKVAIVSKLVSDPTATTLPTIASLGSEFTQSADSDITLTGGTTTGFCIQGKSKANSTGAKNFAASDSSGVVAGTCNAAFDVVKTTP